MNRCILCGKTDVELTEEHIIPRALGNESLKEYCLCKKCNSDLGNSVDSGFVNSFDIQIVRFSLGINGRNGVPNPFEKAKDDEGNLVKVGEDLKPTIVPCIEHLENTERIHAPNKEQAIKMTKKTMERKGLPQERIDEQVTKIENMQPKVEQRTLNYEFSINLVNRAIAVLKIAYEYACLKLDESYFEDKRAKEIRDILSAAINNKVDESTLDKIGVVNYTGDTSHLEQIRKEYLCHFLMFAQNEENCLLLVVSLFCDPFYSYVVVVSNDAQNYSYSEFPELIPVRRQQDN